MKRLTLFLLMVIVIAVSCSTNTRNNSQQDREPEIRFTDRSSEHRIDVLVDGDLFTSYCWPENIYKPILFPVVTAGGTEITRGFPIKPRDGERADHNHHTGMWLTYGNVNGTDFWGNGSRGLGLPNENGGVIRHVGIDELTGGSGEGIMVTREIWTDRTGGELLAEKTAYHFRADGPVRIIDRITTLTAGEKEVSMPDTKEGMFGIRVARQLELPSEGEITLYESGEGIVTADSASDREITGNYRSSEGVSGPEVWGTRAGWMVLSGEIGSEKISLVICDHPENPHYPTFWHARGYGLFAANPLGWNDFTEGREQLNFTIPAGESVTFRYRVIISSGLHLSEAAIRDFAEDFAGRY